MGIKSVGGQGSVSQQESAADEVSPLSPVPRPAAPEETSSVETYSPKEAMQDFDAAMGPAVEGFAKKRQDPTGWFGDVNVTGDQLRYSAVGQALEDPRTSAMLAKMSEGDVRNVIENEVYKAWPKLDGEQTHDLVNKLVGQVKESARYHAMEGMRKEAVSTLRDAAARLNDPKQAEALGKQLGLDSAEVKARAKLMEHEANRIGRAGGDSVFRAMADHDVSKAFMKKAGIEPESLAGRQVEAAREQGKADRESIERMKMACAVAGAFATGGLGATGVAGYATGAVGAVVMNGGSVAEKWEAVDSAKAGEAAGTMPRGGVRNARINAGVATGLMAFEAAAGPLVSKGAHSVENAMEPLVAKVTEQTVDGVTKEVVKGISRETVKGLAHGVTHAGVTAGVQVAEPLLHQENE